MAGKGITIQIQGDGTGAAEALRLIEERMQQTADHGRSMGEQLAAAGEMVRSAFAAIGIGIGIREAIDGLKEMTERSIDLGMEIGHMAQQTGISAQTLSVLRYTAQQTGIDFEVLSKGFKKMSTDIFEWEHGQKTAGEAFQALGISLKDVQAKGQDMYGILEMIANKFQQMPDGPQKLAIAVELFGRAGQQMIPILNQGAAGLDAFKSQAQALGLVLDEAGVKKMEEMHAKATELQGAMEGLALKLTEALGGAMESAASQATDLLIKLAQLMNLAPSAQETAAQAAMRPYYAMPEEIRGASDPSRIAAAAAQQKAAIESELSAKNISEQQKADLQKQWNFANLRENQAYLAALIRQRNEAQQNLNKANDALNSTNAMQGDSFAAGSWVSHAKSELKDINDQIDVAVGRIAAIPKPLAAPPPGDDDGNTGPGAAGMDPATLRAATAAAEARMRALVGSLPASAKAAGEIMKADAADAAKLEQQAFEKATADQQKVLLEVFKSAPQNVQLDPNALNRESVQARIAQQMDADQQKQDQSQQNRSYDAQRAAGMIGGFMDQLTSQALKGKVSFKSLVDSAIMDLERWSMEIMEKQVLLPILDRLFGVGAPGASQATNGAGLDTTSSWDVTGLDAPAMATGGDLDSGWAIVGDGGDGSGSELFAPKGPGTVLPHDVLEGIASMKGGSGGAPNVTINNVNNSSSQVKMSQAGASWDSQAKQFVIHTVLEDMQQGGPLGAAMQGFAPK